MLQLPIEDWVSAPRPAAPASKPEPEPKGTDKDTANKAGEKEAAAKEPAEKKEDDHEKRPWAVYPDNLRN